MHGCQTQRWGSEGGVYGARLLLLSTRSKHVHVLCLGTSSTRANMCAFWIQISARWLYFGGPFFFPRTHPVLRKNPALLLLP